MEDNVLAIDILVGVKNDIKSALEDKGCVVDVGLKYYGDKIRGIQTIDNVESVTDFKAWMTFTGSTATDVEKYEQFNILVDGLPYGGRGGRWGDFSHLFEGCENLTESPSLEGEEIPLPRDCTWMFNGCKKLMVAPNINTSKCGDFERMFYGCTSLTSVPAYTIRCRPADNQGTGVAFMFGGCISLKSVPELDFREVESINGLFINCQELVDIGGLKDFGHEENIWTITTSPRDYGPFYGCKKISRQSILNIFNGLWNRSTSGYSQVPGLYFEPEVLARLSDSDIAIAVNKGWIISSY